MTLNTGALLLLAGVMALAIERQGGRLISTRTLTRTRLEYTH